MTEGPDHVNKDVRPPNRVTIAEAATLLGVHPNTVRNRVRDGTYKAEKVPYLVHRGIVFATRGV